MKMLKNKIIVNLTALFLMITITATSLLIALPAANAHTPAWSIPTYAFISVSPFTVGVGQYAQITMWLNCIPPTSQGIEGDRWQGFIVNVTKPDGNREMLGPFTSDPVGTKSVTYTPDQIGKYTFVFSCAWTNSWKRHWIT